MKNNRSLKYSPIYSILHYIIFNVKETENEINSLGERLK